MYFLFLILSLSYIYIYLCGVRYVVCVGIAPRYFGDLMGTYWNKRGYNGVEWHIEI